MEFYCLILLKLFSSEKSFLSRTAHHHIISSHKDYTFECYRVLLSMDYFAHLIRYSTDFFLPRTTQLRKECRPYCNSTVLRIVMISTYRMKSATSPCDSSPQQYSIAMCQRNGRTVVRLITIDIGHCICM